MIRFLKNLGMSAVYALLTGFVTVAICISIAYLGGPELGTAQTPGILKIGGFLTLVMVWPLLLAQLIIFKSDDSDPEEDDGWEEEKADLLETYLVDEEE